MARRMELTVESRFTINPLRNPLDSAAPRARNFTCSPAISAISAHVLVLPTSSPTRYLSFFAKPRSCFLYLSRFRGGNHVVGVQHNLPRILQIQRLNMSVLGLPLRKIIQHILILAGEIVLSKM